MTAWTSALLNPGSGFVGHRFSLGLHKPSTSELEVFQERVTAYRGLDLDGGDVGQELLEVTRAQRWPPPVVLVQSERDSLLQPVHVVRGLFVKVDILVNGSEDLHSVGALNDQIFARSARMGLAEFDCEAYLLVVAVSEVSSVFFFQNVSKFFQTPGGLSGQLS